MSADELNEEGKSPSEDETMIQTLSCYNQLAKDEGKHSVLIKDKTMVQFLAYSLDSNETKVVQLSLETFDLLARNPKTRNELNSTFGVMEALKATCERDVPDDLKNFAQQIVATLEAPVVSYHRPTFFENSKKFSSNVYSFHVFGLNSDTREKLEWTILKVRGVISVVVYSDHQRCIVRAIEKVTPEMIAEAIVDKAGLLVHLVVKNKNNQEILKDILGAKKIQTITCSDLSPIAEYIEEVDEKDGDEDDDDDLPNYLPEEESPVKEKALHPFDKFRTNAATWVKTATNLFQSSFYW